MVGASFIGPLMLTWLRGILRFVQSPVGSPRIGSCNGSLRLS